MPELPEVETILRALDGGGIINSPLSQIEIKKKFHIKEMTPHEFSSNLIGKSIYSIERKGK
jgi:formamidopyrimidine-DNA glycosylase